MYGVIRKIRQFNQPLECQLDLFDKLVVPLLLYDCEIWGFESLDIIERIHLKFLKYIFNLKRSTPTYMVYGEMVDSLYMSQYIQERYAIGPSYFSVQKTKLFVFYINIYTN